MNTVIRLIRAFGYTRKVYKLSRDLGSVTNFALNDRTHESAMKRMRELWVTNSLLSPILRRYGVHAEGLEDYFWLLCINGAGQWVGGYYVAVASLCFPIPLEYLLKNQDKRPVKDVVFKMIQYFEQGNPYLPIY